MGCQGLAVPMQVMQHVVRVESSFNPYAIGVVGGRLVRQPNNLPEALATVRMLERRGYNFSIGLAQVNRYNLDRYGLDSYEAAFAPCANLQAGSKILAECYHRAERDWGKSFSCYYSGNFSTGFRQGYVQKIYASLRESQEADPGAPAIDVIGRSTRRSVPVSRYPLYRSGSGSAPVAANAPAAAPRWMARAVPVPARDALPTPAAPVAAAQPAGAPTVADSPEARFLDALQAAQPTAIPQAQIPASPQSVPVSPDAVGRAVPTGALSGDVGRAVPTASLSTTHVPAPAPGDRARVAETPAQDAAFVF